MEITEIKQRQQQIQQQIEELQEESEQLQKQLVCIPWRADLDKPYWFISEQGTVESDTELNDVIDNYRYYSGNYYSGAADAQYTLSNKNLAKQIIYIATSLNNGEPIDWRDTRQKKYYMCISFIAKDNVDIIQRYTENYKIPGTIYCKSKYFLEECIKQLGKENLIYFNLQDVHITLR